MHVISVAFAHRVSPSFSRDLEKRSQYVCLYAAFFPAVISAGVDLERPKDK